MKNNFLLFLFLFLSFNPVLTWSKDIFQVGYSDFRPFIWSEAGIPRGIYVDIITEALENRLGIGVRFRPFPARRVMYNVQSGVIDGFIEVSTGDRLKYCVTGRVPVAVGLIGVFTNINNKRIKELAEADTQEELKDFSVITHQSDEWANEKLTGFKIDDGTETTEAAFRKLANNWGDIIFQIEQVGQYNIKHLKLENDIGQLESIAIDPILYQLLISKKSHFADITQQLDEALTAMLNEGVIDQIYQKYQKDIGVKKIVKSQKTKIRLMHYATGTMPKAIDKIAEDFNANHEQYLLKPIHMDMERYKQAMKVLLAGRLPADIFMTWAGYRTQYLVDLGFVEPIDDLWQKTEMNTKFPLSTAIGMTYNGSKFGIPLSHHIVSIVYNKKIFDQLKLEVPKSWNELLAVAKLLHSNNIIPFALGSKERWPAQSWFDYLLVRTAGPEYRAKLMAGAASFNDLEVMEVFEHWRLLINNGYINQNCNDIDYTDATKMIYEGEAAMTLNGTWITGDFENIYHWKGGEDFDIFAFPSINSNVPDVVVGVIDLILQAKTENHTGTEAVLAHFANLKSQMIFSENSGSLAPNKNVPSLFYPPVLKKVSTIIQTTPYEVFSYDLATPQSVAEIGLSVFKDFLSDPNDYEALLNKADVEMKKAFSLKQLRW